MPIKSEVIVYTTHTCPFCNQQKSWLDEHGIEYENIFVDDEQEKAKEMVEISGQMGVPFTRIITENDEVHILGFQEEKLRKELGIIDD